MSDGRTKLGLDATGKDIMVKMSEGNPGALTVLLGLLKAYPDEFILIALHFDDMNMRGSQVWVAYKFCERDFERLKQAVFHRDAAMVAAVNDECLGQGQDERAVQFA